MQAQNHKKAGIMDYWQTITALIGIVFAGGIFYAKTQEMEQRISNLENRSARQYEQSNKTDERIDQLEKDAAYQKGLHESSEHLKTEIK